jgi:hypothetical protein
MIVSYNAKSSLTSFENKTKKFEVVGLVPVVFDKCAFVINIILAVVSLHSARKDRAYGL